jgi:hypothetical protein
MTQNNKARRVSSPLIKKILAEANPLHKLQNKNRIALACRIDDLIKSKGYKKNTKTEQILGIDILSFLKYIESKDSLEISSSLFNCYLPLLLELFMDKFF